MVFGLFGWPAFGLMVAIPLLLIYAVLQTKTTQLIDSLEMGISATLNDNATLESIREGMTLTMNMFVQMMEKNGIQAIDPQGEKFNPELHQAMTMQQNDEVEANTVLAVMQKGYTLNERLIRPAMVVVSKPGAE